MILVGYNCCCCCCDPVGRSRSAAVHVRERTAGIHKPASMRRALLILVLAVRLRGQTFNSENHLEKPDQPDERARKNKVFRTFSGLLERRLQTAHVKAERACEGHRWLWYEAGDGPCSSPVISRPQAPGHDARSVYVASLSYGGTDQITVSTVHLARELNVVNFQGAPFVQVLPIARDLDGRSATARTEALALFPEPHRPHVQLGEIFDLPSTQRCSTARVIDGGLPAVAAELRERQGSNTIRVHVVVACKHYFGPLLSHSEPSRTIAMINQSAVTRDPRNGLPFDVVSFVHHRFESYEQRVLRFASTPAARGVSLKTARLTLLPDAAKPVRSDPYTRQSWEMLRCSPHQGQEEWCGAAFLSHIASHEPDGTLLLFISEASLQDDFPSVEVLRHFWQPSHLGTTPAGTPYTRRMRNDEHAVTECFPLASRFDEAIDRLMVRTQFSRNTFAWQLRSEKMSLVFHKNGLSWYRDFRRNLLRQAELIGSASRSCREAILFESDLLGEGSTTMGETIFLRHVKAGLNPMKMYGVAALNESVIRDLRTELRSSILNKLRWGGLPHRKGKGAGRSLRPNKVLTTQTLFNMTSDASDGALEPFISASPSRPLLKLERALFSVAMLSKAGVLVRSPVSSTFSGWANAIRIATNGTGAAAWVTEDGTRWWKCEHSSGIKLGKCKKEKHAMLPAPQLCAHHTATRYTARLARTAPRARATSQVRSPALVRLFGKTGPVSAEAESDSGRQLGEASPRSWSQKPPGACVHGEAVYEVSVPALLTAAPNAVSLSSLVREELRAVPMSETYSAVERRVPFETAVSNERLAWEHDETLSFERKQLKADPRLKPADIRVTLDHLNQCTECRAQEAALKAVHASSDPIDVFRGWQLLVDDYAIDSWRNILRFINPPTRQQVAMSPPSNSSRSARFGCPCSIVRGPLGSHRLLHTTGAAAGPEHRYKEWPSTYSSSISSDGQSRWQPPHNIVLDGFTRGVTGSLTVSAQSNQAFVAGYEGANSKACLAFSRDGRHFFTVPTTRQTRAARHWKKDGMKVKGKASLSPKWGVAGLETELELDDRPKHLKKSNIKINLRRQPFSHACRYEVRRCQKTGLVWGGGLIMQCVIALASNGSISKPCSSSLEPKLRTLLSDCVDGTRSALGRAGDCNVQPVFDARRQRQLVWFRQDFGTPGGWREIRGVQVVELNGTVEQSRPMNKHTFVPPIQRVGSYYLDRLGKLERFRRQIYSVTLTPYSDRLWLGLITVIEWAKDMSESTGATLPPFQRDTTNIYLVTSRDGVHIDTEWVYARQPLIPKGAQQADWNSGFVLAANEVVASPDRSESRVYYEARQLRHEDRFAQAGVIGMASWRLDTLVGLRAADVSAGPAVVMTKVFRITSERISVLLNVDTTMRADCGAGSVLVELFDEARNPIAGASSAAAVPIVNSIGTQVQVLWKRQGDPQPEPSFRIVSGQLLRLRFTISGSARLYAFLVQSV